MTNKELRYNLLVLAEKVNNVRNISTLIADAQKLYNFAQYGSSYEEIFYNKTSPCHDTQDQNTYRESQVNETSDCLAKFGIKSPHEQSEPEYYVSKDLCKKAVVTSNETEEYYKDASEKEDTVIVTDSIEPWNTEKFKECYKELQSDIKKLMLSGVGVYPYSMIRVNSLYELINKSDELNEAERAALYETFNSEKNFACVWADPDKFPKRAIPLISKKEIYDGIEYAEDINRKGCKDFTSHFSANNINLKRLLNEDISKMSIDEQIIHLKKIRSEQHIIKENNANQINNKDIIYNPFTLENIQKMEKAKHEYFDLRTKMEEMYGAQRDAKLLADPLYKLYDEQLNGDAVIKLPPVSYFDKWAIEREERMLNESKNSEIQQISTEFQEDFNKLDKQHDV